MKPLLLSLIFITLFSCKEKKVVTRQQIIDTLVARGWPKEKLMMGDSGYIDVTCCVTVADSIKIDKQTINK